MMSSISSHSASRVCHVSQKLGSAGNFQAALRSTISIVDSAPHRRARMPVSTRAASEAATSAPAAVAATPQAPALAFEPKAAEDVPGVAGKTIIITGANTGMGLIISKDLALKGADVIMACRSEQRGLAALEAVNGALEEQRRKQGEALGSASLALVDLASLESVRKFSEDIMGKYPHVDQLICNAGIMIPPHSFTTDGFEAQFQVNHLSHYLMTRMLMPSLLSSPSRPRIVHISSLAGENGRIKQGEFWKVAKCRPEEYNNFGAYCQSKLAQVLFTVETNRRYGEKVTVNAVHPGIVNTDLFNRNVPPLVKSVMDSLGKVMEATGLVYSAEKGASTAIYLAENSAATTSTGGYWADCAPKPANPLAFNTELGREWWEESAKAAGIEP